MNRDVCLYAFVSIILFLVGVLFYAYSTINELRAEYSQLLSEYSQYKSDALSQISACRSDLEDTNAALAKCEDEYRQALREISDLNERLSAIHEKIPRLLDLIDEYQMEIEQSMEWFRANATLDAVSKSDEIKHYLERDCVKIVFDPDTLGDVCVINTGCLWLVNENYLGLEYKYDSEIGAWDKLLSLQDFYKNGGGDCEDFALFYKAEWNYLLGLCGDTPVRVVSWVDGSGKFWLDNAKHWYVPDADAVEWSEYVYPAVVCGNIYDPNTGDISGHCVVAFTREPIRRLSDINLLIGAPLVEPQNGMYLGREGNDSGIFLVVSPEDYEQPSNIWQVITDNDMYAFSESYGQWYGYSEFWNLLERERVDLLSLR